MVARPWETGTEEATGAKRPLALLLFVAALLLFACESASQAEPQSAAVFDFVSKPMPRWLLESQGRKNADFAKEPAFHKVLEDGEALDLQQGRVQALLHDKGIGEVSFAEFELDSLLEANLAGDAAAVTLGAEGPFADVVISDLSVSPEIDGIRDVTARVGRTGRGNMALVVDSNGATGIIQFDGVVYRVRHISGAWHAFAIPNEGTSGRNYDDDVDDVAAGDGDGDGDGAADDAPQAKCDSPPAQPATIDLVIGYTQQAREKARAKVENMKSLIRIANLVSNEAFRQSEVRVRFNVVDISQVSYVEQGSFRRHIGKLKKGQDGLQVLLDRRKKLKADVAILVVHDDDDSNCGRAAAINATKQTALAAVNWQCMTNKFSYAHEIGHLAGTRHDHDADPSLPKHAHGYISERDEPEDDVGTIMATQTSCINSGCGRIWHWSNPHVLWGGIPTGTPKKNYNACVWNANAATMAAFDGG